MTVLLNPYRHQPAAPSTVELARWSFTGLTLEAAASDENVTASALTPVGTNVTVEALNVIAYESAPVASAKTAQSTAANAISIGRYLELVVAADTGTIDLESMTFNAARGGSSTPRGFVLRSSADSYAADIPGGGDIPTANPTWTGYEFDLSGGAYQDLTEITFRFYIYAPDLSASIHFDDIVITGSHTAEAEPETFTESFDGVTQATLGPDLTWRAPTSGAFDVASGTARVTPENLSSRALYDQQFDPDKPIVVSAPVTVVSTGTGAKIAAVVACAQAAEETHYEGRVHWTGSAWFARISKSVAGTVTHLASQSIAAPSTGDVVALTVDGDSLSLTLNDSPTTAVTDDSITRGNYCGISGYRATNSAVTQVQWASWTATGVPLVATEFPSSWTKASGNPIADADDTTSSVDQLSGPTVVLADGRIASPLGAYYLWCAPHDNPGGIFLFTADALDGPWTARNSGAPVIALGDVTPSGSHVSSPYVVWNPNTSELMMWVHVGGLESGGSNAQRTYLWTSTDGVAWTEQNSGSPVIQSTNIYDDWYAAYLKVAWDGTQYVGWYIGASASSGPYHSCRATSADGVTWVKEEPPPMYNAAGSNVGNLVLFMAEGDVDGENLIRPTERRLRPTGESDFDDPVATGLSVGASGAWDDDHLGGGDLVHDGTRWWYFYTGAPGSTHAGEQIGVAFSAPRSDFGLVAAEWGKAPAS